MKLDRIRFHKISVKWKVFTYFMIFGAIMLAVLWVFQVELLDQFYKTIKTRAIETAAEEINEAILDDHNKDAINEVVHKNDLCVSILDSNLNETYTSNRYDPRCFIDKMNKTEIGSLYEEALENGGSTSRIINIDEKRKEWKDEHKIELPQEENTPIEYKGRMLQNITYASLLQLQDGQSVIVLVNAEISPVNATVGTIRTQLIIISIILFFLAILLAMMISRKIAKPIIKINNSAKNLAKGEYEVSFEGKGYLEISELNDTLNYAAKELSKVQELQRELIANMSHDLRTPLTMISGYGEMMRDIPGENTPENVQVIIDETTRLTTLVNDILDLSKLQTGTQRLNVNEFNITDMMEDLILRFQKMLLPQKYTIIFEYDERVSVLADESKMNQVFYNLISNAITYSGEDHVVVVKQRIQETSVRIEISDHGVGIAKDELEYVWERYYRSKEHHIRSKLGTGIGLSIVKNILQMHKAHYGVVSELTKGTTFWVEINKKA